MDIYKVITLQLAELSTWEQTTAESERGPSICQSWVFRIRAEPMPPTPSCTISPASAGRSWGTHQVPHLRLNISVSTYVDIWEYLDRRGNYVNLIPLMDIISDK